MTCKPRICLVFRLWFAAEQEWQVFICYLHTCFWAGRSKWNSVLPLHNLCPGIRILHRHSVYTFITVYKHVIQDIIQLWKIWQNLPNLRLPKYKMRWSRSPKVYHALNFIEGAHPCQSDSVPGAGALFSSWHPSVSYQQCPLASFGENTDSASGPICSLCLLCSRGIIGWDLQGWSWRLAFVVLPGAEIEDVGFALPWQCKAHASVNNIEPWESSTARLLYHHIADHVPAGGVLMAG